MRTAPLLLALTAVLALASCGGGDDAPCFAPTDPVPETGRLAGMVAAHNQVRANATPTPDPALPPLSWDADVAAVAQGWADCLAARGCPLEHNANRGHLGENIFWGYASGGYHATPEEVVQNWASEAACYDYATGDCDLDACPYSCGHYTQLVWRDTARVGCGVADCAEGNGEIWVCDYAPPGNSGSAPY